MENKQEHQLIDLILSHYEEAQYIATHFTKAKQQLTEEIRQIIIKALSEKLKNDFLVEPGKDTSHTISQIWIKIKGKEMSGLFFGIESFSGTGSFGDSFFIGTCNASPNIHFKKIKGIIPDGNKFWAIRKVLTEFENLEVNFNAPLTLRKLHGDELKNRFTNHIVEEIEHYLKKHTPILIELFKIMKP